VTVVPRELVSVDEVGGGCVIAASEHETTARKHMPINCKEREFRVIKVCFHCQLLLLYYGGEQKSQQKAREEESTANVYDDGFKTSYDKCLY
jgi:hypothetical protein